MRLETTSNLGIIYYKKMIFEIVHGYEHGCVLKWLVGNRAWVIASINQHRARTHHLTPNQRKVTKLLAKRFKYLIFKVFLGEPIGSPTNKILLFHI